MTRRGDAREVADWSARGELRRRMPFLAKVVLRRAALLATAVLSAQLAGQALGPDPEFLQDERPEAWAMKRFAALTQPEGFGPKEDLAPGKWILKGELSEVPFLSLDERRIGFEGNKVEDLNKAELVARVSGQVGLPLGLSLELAYIPPVEVFDVEAEILSAALSRAIADWGPWRLDGSVSYTYGEATAAFTCSHDLVEAGHDPFNCVPPSQDRNLWRSAAAELTASGPTILGGLWPFASASYQYVDADFQVDALLFDGTFREQRTLKSEDYIWVFGVGAQWQLNDAWRATLAFRWSPLELEAGSGETSVQQRSVNQFRSQLSYRF